MSQEIDASQRCYTNTDNVSKVKNEDKPMVTDNDNDNIKYFLPGPNSNNGKRVSVEITQWLQKEFKNLFNGIGCFNGTFSLQVKPNSQPYQAHLRCIAYALHHPFKEELECLQQQDIMAPLGIDETAEWCKSLALVPKPNGKFWLCLDPARLNWGLIWPEHRGQMPNDIFPKLNNVEYLSLIDVSSEYNSLKLDERSSYLTTFSCQFARYRYKRLSFGAGPTGDMFRRKIDVIFKDLLNVFGITDDILVVGYDRDGKDHDETLQQYYKYADKWTSN